MKLAVVALASTGCAQILGIDNTHLPPHDAASICDGPPATCVATSGRTACGQLFQTGADAGPVRVAEPTATPCAGSSDGPCALMVAAQPLASYEMGMMTGRVSATVDDCGRFVALDVDPMASDIAIIVDGGGYAETATLFLQRPTGVGVDTAIAASTVTLDLRTAWGAQVNGADVTSGFVVTYKTGTAALETEEVRVDGASVMGPGMPPWTAYFSDAGFQTLDPALTATAASGTAFVVPTTSVSSIGGKRMGATCQRDGLLRVQNALQFLTLTSC